jgi:NADH dehydrogenase
VRVIVTGAGGYVGGTIARGLERHGHEVVPFGRAHGLRLGDPVELPEADAIVHSAWDFEARTWSEIHRVDVIGSLLVLEAAHRTGIERRVFISTMSAFDGCRSMYGRAKLAVERDMPPGIVLRPGLVWDDDRPQGMVGALARLAERLPVVPLVGRGHAVLHSIHAEDLVALVDTSIARRGAPTEHPFVAAHPEPLTLREIVVRLAAAAGRSPRFVPIPTAVLHRVLQVGERFGATGRLRADGLIGLVHHDPAPRFAGLDELGVPLRPFLGG